MSKTLKCVAAVALSAPLLATTVAACCMVPRTYKGTISQDAQEAVLVHHNGREELVLRINYKLSGKTLPKQFAWVITVPNEPDHYAVAEPKLFEDMFRLSERLLRRRSRSKGPAPSDGDELQEGGVELGKRVQVGPYDIQPVRARGTEALAGLNRWLKKNGFPGEDPKHMKYFVQKKFTFLCVKIAPPKGKQVSQGGLLPPLHLSFKSKEIYYPLRFSSRQGVFDVNLHVLTKTKLDYDLSKNMLAKLNWSSQRLKRNVTLKKALMPTRLTDMLKKSKLKNYRGTPWYYNNIRSRSTNLGSAIARWDEDVFLNRKSKKEYFVPWQKGHMFRPRRPKRKG